MSNYVDYPSAEETDDESDVDLRNHYLKIFAAACGPALLLTILGCLIIYFLKKCLNKSPSNNPKDEKVEKGNENVYVSKPNKVPSVENNVVLIDEVTSGSGAGMPSLNQVTLAKQITILGDKRIGKGKFGEVYKGVLHGEKVAVKISPSREEASWTRETEIYSMPMIQHESILRYIGSDMTSKQSCTQLWLVTKYHSRGSLYDYLRHKTISQLDLLFYSLSITNGLLHLHMEINGTQGKPAIAHRDIKTKNILVKSDGKCCIADFGNAITSTHLANKVPINVAVGTKRYMAPEILDNSLKPEYFDSFLQADIYALSMVFWELCRRTNSYNREGHLEADEFKLPYFETVPNDPSEDDMRNIVCTNKLRPCISPRWYKEEIISCVMNLMRECWHDNPSARLSTLRIKKRLSKLTVELSF